MKTTAFLLVLASLISCSSGVPKAAGDIAAKGSVVAAAAGGGALLGGPLGAFVGGVLGFFGVELAEVEVELEGARAEWEAERSAHAENVRQAQATGQQQGSDQAATFLAQLRGDADAVEFFREKAGEAIEPLQQEIDAARADLLAHLWGFVWKGVLWLAVLTGVVGLIWWLTRKETKAQGEKLARLDSDPPAS